MADLNLTKRQQEIFDFIKRYSAKYGYPPTVRDIGKAIGLTSSSTVHAHLANLEKVGLLRARPDQAARDRAARRPGQAAAVGVEGGLPLVGQVAAGEPVLAEENIEEYVADPAARRRRRGRVPPPHHRRLDDRRGHPRRRPRRGAHAGHGPQRRDRRRARRGRRGHGQALLQGDRPRAAPAGERCAGADPSAPTSRCSARWSESSGGSREHRGSPTALGARGRRPSKLGRGRGSYRARPLAAPTAAGSRSSRCSTASGRACAPAGRPSAPSAAGWCADPSCAWRRSCERASPASTRDCGSGPSTARGPSAHCTGSADRLDDAVGRRAGAYH